VTETDTLIPEIDGNIFQLAEIQQRAQSVLGDLSEDQLNWKPAPARWSVGECVLHMLETNVGYSRAIEEKMGEARAKGKLSTGPFRYGWFSRWFVGLVEPPVKRRLPAPKTFVPPPRPAKTGDVQRFVESVDRIAEMNRAANGLDLRVKIASPATKLVRLELGMALKLLGAHTLRHLLQAEAVTKEAGFPGPTQPGERP
jgi:hypothetical protein